MIKHKVVVTLMNREKEYMLTYVVLSQVTKFSNLGTKDTERISKNRLYRKINIHSKIKKCLIEEERLHKKEQRTLNYLIIYLFYYFYCFRCNLAAYLLVTTIAIVS